MGETNRQLPEGWLESKMNLINKKSNTASIHLYRPLTVTSVVYRFVMETIKSGIHARIEQNEILGKLQNGVREDSCLDDDLFVITQSI